METEWEKFGEIVKECTNDVFGVRHVGEKRRKRSEWWSEVGVVVAEKRRAFEDWLQRRYRVSYDRCLAQTAVVRQTVNNNIP